jgi:hypothetical protein
MLLLVGPPQAVNATLYEELNYNFLRDIAPVASIRAGPRYALLKNGPGLVSTGPSEVGERCLGGSDDGITLSR